MKENRVNEGKGYPKVCVIKVESMKVNVEEWNYLTVTLNYY